MITWIQRSFIKHGKWMFSILLVIIIFAFVLTITSTVGLNVLGDRSYSRYFFDIDMTSQRQVRPLMQGAEVSFWVENRYHLREQNQLEFYAYTRYAGLKMANELGIPEPDEKQLLAYIASREMFQDEDGNFDPASFVSFKDQVATEPNLTEGVVARAMAEDYRIEQVREALGGPGYVLPYEAIRALEQEQTLWTVELATLPRSEFSFDIEPSEEELREHFEENALAYRIGEQVDTKLVRFPAASFTAQVEEPEESELQTYFQRNRWRYRQAATPDPENTDAAAVELDDVRDQVVADWKREEARTIAQTAADDFAYSLFRNKVARGSDAFTRLVAERRGVVEDLEPYGEDQLPIDSGVFADGLRLAFSLDNDRYYSDVARTRDGAAILIYEGTVPPRDPAYQEVAAAVREDLVSEMRREAFIEHGRALRKQFSDALAEGRAFSDVAEAAGLEVTAFDEFPGSEPPREFTENLFMRGRNLEVGNVSPMVVDARQGKFVYLADRKRPDIDPQSEEVRERIEQIGQLGHNLTGDFFIAELANRELQRTNLN